MTDRACTIDGCGGELVARGWCSKHYERWRVHGDPLVTLQHRSAPPLGDQCSVEGCISAHKTRGWCGKHYQRWAKYGDPTVTVGTPPDPHQGCSVGDCGGEHSGRGMCRKHLARWAKHGDPLTVKRQPLASPYMGARSSVCIIEGCGKGQHARGWCSMHYHRWAEYGDPLVGGPGNAALVVCPVCLHPDVEAIEDIIRDASMRGRRIKMGTLQAWGVDSGAVARHRKRHLDNDEHAAKWAAAEIQRLEATRAKIAWQATRNA